MFTPSEYVMTRMNQDNNARAYREAEKYRQLRQAGLIRSNNLSRVMCRAAGSLGRVMVTLGQRLVQLEGAASQAFQSPAGLKSA